MSGALYPMDVICEYARTEPWGDTTLVVLVRAAEDRTEGYWSSSAHPDDADVRVIPFAMTGEPTGYWTQRVNDRLRLRVVTFDEFWTDQTRERMLDYLKSCAGVKS